jgi:hypothetical protein
VVRERRQPVGGVREDRGVVPPARERPVEREGVQRQHLDHGVVGAAGLGQDVVRPPLGVGHAVVEVERGQQVVGEQGADVASIASSRVARTARSSPSSARTSPIPATCSAVAAADPSERAEVAARVRCSAAAVRHGSARSASKTSTARRRW